MISPNLFSKIFALVFAAFVVNQLACSNASFDKSEETKGQRAPSPDSPNGGFENFDSGDATSCRNSNKTFCDPGDDGLNPNPPAFSWDSPECTTHKGTNNCYINKCKGSSGKKIGGVEVWLIVDSSRSFDEERVAVGRAILNGFIRAMGKGVPVVVKVIVGHAPSGPFAGVDANDGIYKTVNSSAPSLNSDIFYRHSSEPLAITIRPGMSSRQLQLAENDLMLKLQQTMHESPISYGKNSRVPIEVKSGQYHSWQKTGPHSGSDELGLRNFVDALKMAPKPPADYAWVVLFMSDENDACTPFVSGGTYSYSHPDEAEMKAWYCSAITPSHAYAKAVEFAEDRPYMFGAFVYTGQAPIPYSHPSVHSQASFGLGYTNMVAKGGERHGVMVDLASAYNSGNLDWAAGQIIDGLAFKTSSAEGAYADFRIQNESGLLPLTQVRTRNQGGQKVFNMQVYVDGAQCGYDIDSANSFVRPHCVGDEVEIRFCTQ